MTTIISRLSDDLKTELKTANEIWVAVGLLNLNGLEFILKTIPSKCKMHFIACVDLPTDPKALTRLLSLKLKQNITANILIQEFFHPKVYIIKSNKRITAFVGSANCTNGGLKENIEMSIQSKEQEVCKELIYWFEKELMPNSQPLTSDFIKDYKPKYDNRIKKRRKENEQINDFKEQEENKLEANIEYKTKFISELRKFRRTKEYLEHKKERQIIVRRLRKCLDYPNFKHIDFKTFFSIKELGTIVAIKVKSKILASQKKFTSLMKFICDETIPLKERIDEAMNGEKSIENIKEGFISKVLVIHRPKLYYVHNDAFIEILQPFNLTLPRGLSFGEKYELIRNILKEIMKETKIDDFATLDQCLWMLEE